MTADNLTALAEVTHGVIVAAMNALIAEEIRIFGEQKTPHNGARCDTMKAALTAALPLLLAARDAERGDAARYRWLRDESKWDTVRSIIYGENCDAAIDAALQADTARAEGEA